MNRDNLCLILETLYKMKISIKLKVLLEKKNYYKILIYNQYIKDFLMKNFQILKNNRMNLQKKI